MGFVNNLNPQVAERLRTLLLVEKKAIPLGFTQKGQPAIVGLTVREDDAIVPKVVRNKQD